MCNMRSILDESQSRVISRKIHRDLIKTWNTMPFILVVSAHVAVMRSYGQTGLVSRWVAINREKASFDGLHQSRAIENVLFVMTSLDQPQLRSDNPGSCDYRTRGRSSNGVLASAKLTVILQFFVNGYKFESWVMGWILRGACVMCGVSDGYEWVKRVHTDISTKERVPKEWLYFNDRVRVEMMSFSCRRWRSVVLCTFLLFWKAFSEW